MVNSTYNPETDGAKASGSIAAQDASDHASTAVEHASAAVAAGQDAIKSRFSKAIDEARASAEALRDDAVDLTLAAREKAAATAADWTGQAKDKSLDLARQGKDKTSEAIVSVSKAIADTAPVIDEKLGKTYGDYARSAAGALEGSAQKLAAKDITDLGDDVKAFVRASPATALGIAAVTGYLFARLFSRSSSSDA